LDSSDVKAFYEKFPFPGEFKTGSKFYRFFLAPLGIKLDALRGKTILDAGCGTGEVSCSLAKSGANITAVDLSSASIARARALAKKEGLKNVNFINSDLADFNTPKRFDFVFSIGVIHHTPNPSRTFDKVAGFLKPGGLIVILLYSRYGRLLHNVRQLFKRYSSIDNAKDADLFIHPLESQHSLGEVGQWFERNGIDFVGAYPFVKNLSFWQRFKNQLLWIPIHQSSFVVAGRKRLK